MKWQKFKDVIAIILIWLMALSMVYIVYVKTRILFRP